MKRTSLRARLTWLTIFVMFFVLVPVGVIGFQHESRAMEGLLDSRLAQAGRSVASLIAHGARLPLLVARTPNGERASSAVVSVDIFNADPEVDRKSVV